MPAWFEKHGAQRALRMKFMLVPDESGKLLFWFPLAGVHRHRAWESCQPLVEQMGVPFGRKTCVFLLNTPVIIHQVQ